MQTTDPTPLFSEIREERTYKNMQGSSIRAIVETIESKPGEFAFTAINIKTRSHVSGVRTNKELCWKIIAQWIIDDTSDIPY